MKKKKTKLSSFSILMLIILALALVSRFIPGVTPATVGDFTMSVYNGYENAVDVCIFVTILGGFLEIVNASGALNTGVAVLVRKLRGKEEVLIAVLMFLFSIGGTTYGMCEETVPFYLLLATTMVAAGMDTLVGAAVVLLGAGVGVLGSTINPFATGIAMSTAASAGVDINSGTIMLLGAILWISSYLVALFFVLKYAKKVKADKGSTFLSLQEQEDMKAIAANTAGDDAVITGRQKAVLILFAFTFVIMICGFIPWVDLGIIDPDIADAGTHWSAFLTGNCFGYWWFSDGTTWFLLMSIIIAIVAKMSEKEYVNNFIAGAGGMMSVVLVIAVARGAKVIMSSTGLDVWILDSCAKLLQGVSATLFAPIAYLVYIPLSFFIPSSSGLATVSMPVFAPLAAKLGFSPEAMVMIFSAGNGLVNLFTPTSGAIMGGLALAKVEWTTWVKWAWKCIVVIAILNIVILTAAMLIL